MNKTIWLLLLLFIASIVLPCGVSSSSKDSPQCDWPMYYCTPDGKRSVGQECGPASKEIIKLWSYDSNSYFGDPIVVGDKVWATTNDRIVCINLKSGELVWENDLGEDGSYNHIATVYYENGKLYTLKTIGKTSSYRTYITCIDSQNGATLWDEPIEKCHWYSAFCSGKLYYVSSNSINIFDVANRKKLTKSPISIKNRISGTLTAFENRLVIGAYNYVYCYELNDDGTVKSSWSFEKKGIHMYGKPSISSDKVFVFGSEYTDKGYLLSNFLVCLDIKTGKKLWIKSDFKCDNIASRLDNWANFVYLSISGNNLVIGLNDNYVYCLDIENGNTKWKTQLTAITYSMPIIYGNNVVVRTDSGKTEILELGTGKKIFAYDSEQKENIFSNAIAHGKIVEPADNKLVCFGEYDPNNQIPAKIVIEPKVCNLKTGKKQQFTATVYDIKGKQVTDRKLEWSLDDSRIGTIDSNGLLVTKNVGKCNVICKVGNVSESAKVYVVEAIPGKVVVEPNPAKVHLGSSKQFSFVLYDTDGETIENYKCFWSVSGNAGTIDKDGFFKGTSLGACKVYVTAGKASGYADVEVLEFVTANPNPVVFENVCVGTVPKIKVEIKNNIDKELSLNFSSSSELISFEPKSLSLSPESPAFVYVAFDAVKAARGHKGQYEIEIVFDEGVAKLPASVSVLETDPVCVMSSISSLVFGHLKRGTTKSIEFELTSSRDTTAFIKASEPWIDLSAREAKLSKDIPAKIRASISSSSIPTGEIFTSEIVVTTNDGDCKGTVISVTVSTDKSITISLVVGQKMATINDEIILLDTPAQLINGRTMVPLRFITEAFGCKVNWEPVEGKITIVRHSMVFYLWKGKNIAVVNGVEQKLDSPPVIVGGRTLVPLRFISEPFGAKVNWDNNTKTITIVWEPN